MKLRDIWVINNFVLLHERIVFANCYDINSESDSGITLSDERQFFSQLGLPLVIMTNISSSGIFFLQSTIKSFSFG